MGKEKENVRKREMGGRERKRERDGKEEREKREALVAYYSINILA